MCVNILRECDVSVNNKVNNKPYYNINVIIWNGMFQEIVILECNVLL